MKSENTSLEDLKAIRKIMEESSRFLSLSGLSGVLAGLTATAGGLAAYFLILKGGTVGYDESTGGISGNAPGSVIWWLVACASLVLVISVLFALFLAVKKAARTGKLFWTPVSKRLLINLLIPLATGGIFAVILILQNNLSLIIPSLLIFYGLALVNAGKFTFSEIVYLGILEVLTGLAAAFFSGGDLFFWIFGFGLLHVVYGLALYGKYES